MNQEIKEYWEKFHGDIKAAPYGDGSSYWITESAGQSYCIAMTAGSVRLLGSKAHRDYTKQLAHLKDDDWTYPFNGAFNDEKTMLKLLKLKAFL